MTKYLRNIRYRGALACTSNREGRVWCGFESKKLLHIFHLLVYDWVGGVLMYNHPKHKHLPDKVRGILMNQKEGQVNKRTNQNEEKELKEKSFVREINRKISIAMNGVMGLPDTHLKDFNNIWFSLTEKIADFSRKEELDDKTVSLLNEMLISEVFVKEDEIASKQDICGRLEEISKIVDKYVD